MERFDPHGARAGLLGLLAVQAIIGYEWLMSGMTKLVRGGFPAGLEAELGEKSEGAASWYRAILDHVVIPNAFAFGVVVIAAEIAVGLALVASAAVWAFRAERVGAKTRAAMLLTTFGAAVGGIVMNLNFHLANGSAHPWLIPGDGFDEGVDLDSLMPLVQLVIAVVALVAWRRGRTTSTRESADCLSGRAPLVERLGGDAPPDGTEGSPGPATTVGPEPQSAGAGTSTGAHGRSTPAAS